MTTLIYYHLIKSVMSSRADRIRSSSPQRSRQRASKSPPGEGKSPSGGGGTKSGGPRSSRSSKSSKSGGRGSRLSGGSKADNAAAASAGKPSTITSRRVRLQSADLQRRGLRRLDMSGQGMTVLAASTFNNKDIGELDLSSNNIRVLPTEISRLESLVHIDLSRNGIRCAHGQDFTGLPKELARLPNLEVMILSECNLPFIPPAIWKCTNLRVLDISRNKITVLVPEIGSLEKLQHLNAQQTSILTLPPEIALCQELEEVMLWGNVIESLPETLKEMPKLKVLAINHRSFCASVDDYREGLLKKGQIQSEHIPPVLFEIPALDSLDLNETKLNTLPDQCIGQLKDFFLAKNFFTRVPGMILTMDSLEILDLTDNMIKSFPEEVGKLVNLTSLKLDNNKISSIPATVGNLAKLTSLMVGGNLIYTIPPEIGNLTELKTLVLDRNNIREIPETIVNLTQLETLDLTDNKIRTLPINFHKMAGLRAAHTYQKFHKYGLWLHKNPLTTPPQDVWQTDNPTQIFRYLKRLQIQRTENLQRQKLYVIGAAQSGKTSLVVTMTTGKSVLTEGEVDSTAMVDFYVWKTDNGVDFLIHDMGGADVYKHTHHLFLDTTGIYLVTYDMSAYTGNRFHDLIGCWIELVQLHVPGAVVKIIGTQSDKLDNPEAIAGIQQEVEEKVREMMTQRQQKLEQVIPTLDKMGKEEKATEQEKEHLKTQKFRAAALKRQPIKLQPSVCVSSAEGIPGILSLVNDLELTVVNNDLCPHAQKAIPDHWFKFRLALKARKELCITLGDVKQIAKAKKFPRAEISDCLSFLTECGEILWFREIAELQSVVFPRPPRLVDILKGVFHHNMSDFLNYDDNRIFKCKGQMDRATFDKYKYMYETTGQISRSLLLCLWFHQDLSRDSLSELLTLIPAFDLCYTVPQPDVPNPRDEFTPLMVVPSGNHDDSTPDLTEVWPTPLPPGQPEVTVTVEFPVVVPQVYERLACRLQSVVTARADWRDTVYAETDTGAVLLRSTPGGGLRLAVRGLDDAATRDLTAAVWARLRDVLAAYRGLVWTCHVTDHVTQG